MKSFKLFQLLSITFCMFLMFSQKSVAQLSLNQGNYIAKEVGTSKLGLKYDAQNEAGSLQFPGRKLKFVNEAGETNMMINFDRNILHTLNSLVLVESSEPNFGNVNYNQASFSFTNVRNIAQFNIAAVDTLGSNALQANGDVTITGSLYFPSDRKFKSEIQPVQGAINDIMNLRPASYIYNISPENRQVNRNLPLGKQTGFIAQELKEVLPHLVTKKYIAGDNAKNPFDQQESFYAINYVGIVPILVKGIQDQQKEIKKQALEIESLKAQMLNLEEKFERSMSRAGAEAKKDFYVDEKISIQQNYPNPFFNDTNINYFIPSNYNSARILITDLSGKTQMESALEIGQVDSIHLTISDWPAGIYFYSIEIDGLIMESNKMIKK